MSAQNITEEGKELGVILDSVISQYIQQRRNVPREINKLSTVEVSS
jgi:hypothetical protein